MKTKKINHQVTDSLLELTNSKPGHDMTHYAELVWAEYDRLTNNWEKFELADKVEVPELAEEIRARIKEERADKKENQIAQ